MYCNDFPVIALSKINKQLQISSIKIGQQDDLPTRYIIIDIKKVPEGARRKVAVVQDQHNNARLRIQK